ncbi:cysteine--tRNA ligase [Gemella sp. zg-570]|uniref:cysteine--tRNA ligase n=1 Tax=Gemella sp. zg-570 TaxID=2840371 RepID=UPI001C0C3660|nr:cysteine--tRNA ligase [Gemella sp. zg-570]QWQ39020.1 cysteine--tRNA ligase [Gemella sp. zg-570]
MIKIYNTLTQKKEIFKPIEDNKVKMYVCGPTVYNYIHIGNARPIISFDVVRRYFEYAGYDIKYVSNFTDVDDKIIKASQEEKIPTKDLTDKYIQAFYEDYDALGCKRADSNPRVSDYIPEIIEFIKKLVDEDFAYEVNGDVYFRTRRKKDYGKLSKQSIEDLISGARVEANDQKEDPLDFALWKAAKAGEVFWASPFGNGRPGWHIECSVMAKETLGTTIDIHAGGQDLTFPHHENEIAQSECHNHAQFSNYWMHNGFINIDGTKMSKSLGNFTLLKDIRKSVEPMVIRLFMLSVHYRTPINYSLETIELAKTNYNKIKTSYQNLLFRLANSMTQQRLDDDVVNEASDNISYLEEQMNDDFNTANALSSWYDLVRITNVYTERDEVNKETLEVLKATFETYVEILGISLVDDKANMEDEKIDNLINKREEARKNRDFALADKIRDDLKEQGIILEDTKQGVRWKRI